MTRYEKIYGICLLVIVTIVGTFVCYFAYYSIKKQDNLSYKLLKAEQIQKQLTEENFRLRSQLIFKKK